MLTEGTSAIKANMQLKWTKMKKVVQNVKYLSKHYKLTCYINHLKMKIRLHFNKSLMHSVMYKEGVYSNCLKQYRRCSRCHGVIVWIYKSGKHRFRRGIKTILLVKCVNFNSS